MTEKEEVQFIGRVGCVETAAKEERKGRERRQVQVQGIGKADSHGQRKRGECRLFNDL